MVGRMRRLAAFLPLCLAIAAPARAQSEAALKDFASGLEPLGASQSFVQTRQGLRGGMTLRVYQIKLASKTLRAWTYEMPDGKLEQYQIAVQE